MKRLAMLLVLAGFGLALSSCYPNRLDNVSYDMVATRYDKTANFATAGTYALADTIVHLVQPGGLDDISRLYDSQVLARVEQNMNARGYTKVANPDNADLVLVCAATTSEYYAYYYDDWCYYWGWYYGGCGYYGYPTTVTYEVGTLLIGMLDTRVANSSGQKPVVWLAGLNGLLNYATTTGIASRLNAGIDEAFGQSPYIQSTVDRTASAAQ